MVSEVACSNIATEPNVVIDVNAVVVAIPPLIVTFPVEAFEIIASVIPIKLLTLVTSGEKKKYYRTSITSIIFRISHQNSGGTTIESIAQTSC